MIIHTYVRLTTTSDINGNPRRLIIVTEFDLSKDPHHHGGSRVAVLDEGYEGESIVRKAYPKAIRVGEFGVAPGTYRDWIRTGKIDQKYRDEESQKA